MLNQQKHYSFVSKFNVKGSISKTDKKAINFMAIALIQLDVISFMISLHFHISLYHEHLTLKSEHSLSGHKIIIRTNCYLWPFETISFIFALFWTFCVMDYQSNPMQSMDKQNQRINVPANWKTYCNPLAFTWKMAFILMLEEVLFIIHRYRHSEC